MANARVATKLGVLRGLTLSMKQEDLTPWQFYVIRAVELLMECIEELAK